MVSLFPALIAIAAIIGQMPYTVPLRVQLGDLFDRVLPSDVSPILQSYFVEAPHNARSARVVIVAVIVSILGASGVIAKFMEGLRRANGLPRNCWSVWQRRARAFLLVPLSLLPFMIVSLLVVFGHLIVAWLTRNVMPEARGSVIFIAIITRWTVALTGSVGLIALIFHMGTPMQQSWKRTLPGAIAATAMWFLATLGFGWYVTRFANYSQVYSSLGTGIALLFWLYIISLCILLGAEINAMIYYTHPSGHHELHPPADSPAHPIEPAPAAAHRG